MDPSSITQIIIQVLFLSRKRQPTSNHRYADGQRDEVSRDEDSRGTRDKGFARRSSSPIRSDPVYGVTDIRVIMRAGRFGASVLDLMIGARSSLVERRSIRYPES
jgi:hypothetical protein